MSINYFDLRNVTMSINEECHSFPSVSTITSEVWWLGCTIEVCTVLVWCVLCCRVWYTVLVWCVQC